MEKKSKIWWFWLFKVPGFLLFLDFGFLEGSVLHKGAWVTTLLGTLLGVQD